MYIKYSNHNMKQTIIISMLLLMSAATHAQRVPCAKGFYPHGTPRHATRAEPGKPTQYVGSKRGLIILMEFPNLKFINKNKNGKTTRTRTARPSMSTTCGTIWPTRRTSRP